MSKEFLVTTKQKIPYGTSYRPGTPQSNYVVIITIFNSFRKDYCNEPAH